MSLNHGRAQLSIPGPSVMPDRVLRAMHQASPNIYEGPLIDLTASLYPDLKTVAQTKYHCAIYISNGHGAWEAAIANSFSRGDTVLVLVTGRFADGWGQMAARMGVQIDVIDFGNQGVADPDVVRARLAADKSHKIKAIFVVQTDTASSVRNDIPALRAAIDAAHHPALFMVDCIASLACDQFEMDNWGVDVMVAGCQKGLMTPAGLSFVFFNDRAAKARDTADLVSNYWDWVPRTQPNRFYEQFGGTAPTHQLFGLREALNMIVHEEGIEQVWARHETFSKAVWAAVEAWGHVGEIALNIADPAHRSRAVTTVWTGPKDEPRLRKWCEHQAGLTLGVGLGMSEPGLPGEDRVFRIGHMGHLNVVMVMGLLGTLETGLTALDIAHGTGAIEAAAKVMATHAA